MSEKRKSFLWYGIIAAVSLTAFLVRAFSPENPQLAPTAHWTRSILYLLLFSFWGISFGLRVIQKQARRYLLSISFFIVFWMSVRTLKYLVADSDLEVRLLWYAFYIPLLWIPTLALLLSLSIGKKDDYVLPKKQYSIFAIPIVLSIGILTNDYHQLAFRFTKEPWTETDYTYSVLLYLAVLWIAFCAFSCLVVLFKKTRVPKDRKSLLLPLIPMGISLVYAILYPFQIFLIGDMTVFHSLCILATLECFVKCGLIRANTQYEALFKASSMPIYIADKHINPIIASRAVQDVQKETLRQALNEPTEISKERLLHSATIQDGYVFWSEDISKIHALLEELRFTEEELKGENDLLQAENEAKEKNAKLDTMHHLYQQMLSNVAEKLRVLKTCLDEADENSEDFPKQLSKICIVGAFVKRKTNLILLHEHAPQISVSEFSYCMRESLDHIETLGISCFLKIEAECTLPMQVVLSLYDFFEDTIEQNLSRFGSLLIQMTEKQDEFSTRWMFGTNENLILPKTDSLVAQGMSLQIFEEEGDTVLEIKYRQGGDAL